MWSTYLQPSSIDDVLSMLAERDPSTRLIAGGTDILVELSRGIRPAKRLIDLTRVDALDFVHLDDDIVRIGALATHNDVVASSICVEHLFPLAQACWEVGAPQLRTRGTVAGNLITASPANDTITPLVALGADVVLRSKARTRTVPISDFYVGPRKTVLLPDELLTEIRVPAMRSSERGTFVKLGLRRAQAISVIDLAVVVGLDEQTVTSAAIAMGAVAPTILRSASAE